VISAGAGERPTAAAAAHGFPRGDWQQFPAGACGGTGFGGVAKHPLQLGAAGAPWGSILGGCSSAESTPLLVREQQLESGGRELDGASSRVSRPFEGGDALDAFVDGATGYSGGGGEGTHGGVGSSTASSRRASRDGLSRVQQVAPLTPPLGGSRPSSSAMAAWPTAAAAQGLPQLSLQQQQHYQHQQQHQQQPEPPSSVLAHYPFPPYRTAAYGGIDYGPITPKTQPRPAPVFAPRSSATEEYLPAPGGPPTLSTLQMQALRDRGRLPPHHINTSVLPTVAIADAAAMLVAQRQGVSSSHIAAAMQRVESGGSRGGADMDWRSRMSSPMSAKVSAAAQRSGRGAASCLRYD